MTLTQSLKETEELRAEFSKGLSELAARKTELKDENRNYAWRSEQTLKELEALHLKAREREQADRQNAMEIRKLDNKIGDLYPLMERREQQADERILAMDNMMQEREMRADQRLQALTRSTDDKLTELMQVISAPKHDPAERGPSASVPGSTALLMQTASAYPLYSAPVRDQGKTAKPTGSKTKTHLRPPTLTLEPA